jgi:hypothetical protein
MVINSADNKLSTGIGPQASHWAGRNLPENPLRWIKGPSDTPPFLLLLFLPEDKQYDFYYSNNHNEHCKSTSIRTTNHWSRP